MYGDFMFTLIGSCTHDRELSVLANGQHRASINLAVNVPRKDKDGDWQEQTTWVRVAVFGDRARSASVDKCMKGTAVYIRGTVSSYTQEIGEKNYTMYNFRPDVIRPLGSGRSDRRDDRVREEDEIPVSPDPLASPRTGSRGSIPSPDDDIPFG